MLKKPKIFLRGQQSGDFSPEKLLGAQKTEHFPGVIVQPLLDLFDFPGRDLAQVGALRDVPPDEAVLVLVAASFAWCVWVAVVDLGALAFAAAFLFHAGRVGELAAIVDRDAGEDLRE